MRNELDNDNAISEKELNDKLLAEAEAKFIALDKQKTEIKKFYDEYAAAVTELCESGGIGHHFQDADGTVYQLEEATGKFVYFEKFAVKRTRREGEKTGDLSMTKARELGYTVEGK